MNTGKCREVNHNQENRKEIFGYLLYFVAKQKQPNLVFGNSIMKEHKCQILLIQHKMLENQFICIHCNLVGFLLLAIIILHNVM